ncbi:MAG: alpha/beta hydrolase [Bacteroidota bacterium]
MDFTTSDNKKLFYDYHLIDNTKPTLVFLNGLTQSTISWAMFKPYFEASHNILLMDFVFQGQSDKNAEVRNFDLHAQDVKELLGFLHLDNPILLGISYGSLVAQHYAVNYSDNLSKLILLSTFAKKNEFYKAIELSWQRALDAGGYELMLDIMLPYVLSDVYFQNPLMPIDLMKSMRKDLHPNSEHIKKLMQATQQRADYIENLQNVKVPTLVIQGEKDLLFPPFMAKEVASAIKNAQLEIIQNAGHTLNLEKTDKVIEAIKKFL